MNSDLWNRVKGTLQNTQYSLAQEFRELYNRLNNHVAKGIGNSIGGSVFIGKRCKILFTVLSTHKHKQRTLNRNSVLMGNQSGRIDHSKEKLVAVPMSHPDSGIFRQESTGNSLLLSELFGKRGCGGR